MSRRWQTIERRRLSYYRQVERWALEHLRGRQQAALEALSADLTPAEAIGRAAEAGGDEQATRRLLLRTYQGVALPFAQESWSNLTEQSFGNEEGKAGAGDMVLKADPPEDEWVRLVRQYLSTEAAEKVIQITDTTRETIRRVLGQAVADGAGIEEMGRALREEMPKLSRSRAVMISRTEVLSASARGALIGAQSTGLNLNKIWLSTADGRTRESHAAANNQTVPMGTPFTVAGERLDHPGDVSYGASAENVVQCRCAIAFEPAT